MFQVSTNALNQLGHVFNKFNRHWLKRYLVLLADESSIPVSGSVEEINNQDKNETD